MTPLLAQVSNKTLDEALRAARDRAQAFDAATKPVNQTIDQIENLLARQAACLEAKASAPASGRFPHARLHGGAVALRGAAL